MSADNSFRRARIAAGLDQDALAERSGVPQATISRVERGANPTLSTAFPLAIALGQPIEVVFADYAPTSPDSPAPPPKGSKASRTGKPAAKPRRKAATKRKRKRGPGAVKVSPLPAQLPAVVEPLPRTGT